MSAASYCTERKEWVRHKKGVGEIGSEKKQHQRGGEGNGKAVEQCTLQAVFNKNCLDDPMKEH